MQSPSTPGPVPKPSGLLLPLPSLTPVTSGWFCLLLEPSHFRHISGATRWLCPILVPKESVEASHLRVRAVGGKGLVRGALQALTPALSSRGWSCLLQVPSLQPCLWSNAPTNMLMTCSLLIMASHSLVY
uniref:Uncharacterized protein n=1 Tax=Pipistrellus kuhlii TaxID=59472 RepID=A0A7J7YMT1_PIPKU|nr:hypothetical protein mPipKuh1_010125 [Pipistrellus kuhlii]